MMKYLVVLLSVSQGLAFQLLNAGRLSTKLYDATGGWGVGNSREMGDVEKAGGDRRSFEKYDAQEQGQFLRQVQEDRRAMLESTKAELMGVAEFAGIDFTDPKDNKFSVDLFMDDEDDLDLSVQFDDAIDPTIGMVPDDDISITRMDEDTGAPGVW